MATLSQNITQAISDLNAVKAAIENKGVTVSSGTPTSDYADLIGDIPIGSDIGCLVDGTVTSVVIPAGTTKIRYYAFNSCTSLTSVTIPSSVTNIGSWAFQNCYQLTSVTIPNGISWINSGTFMSCYSLTSVNIPSSIIGIGNQAFQGCSSLRYVTIENGFNANNLKLSDSTLYTVETIVSWLNALADRTGETAYTLTIGATNLNKLTADQIAIATNKNWNLA